MRVNRIATSAVAVALAATGWVAGAEPVGAAAPPVPGVTATTVTVGQITDISAPIAGIFEGAKVGAEAYFAYVNSKGGVNGRKLVLDPRDSAFSAGTVTSEAQAIAKSDFAMVGGFSLLDSAEQSIIDASKLPDVAEVLSPAMYADPNVYSPVPLVEKHGAAGQPTGPLKWLKKTYPQGAKAVGDIGSNAAASAVQAELGMQRATRSVGFKWLYSRDSGFTETTYLPDMIKMKDAGVKMVFEYSLPGNNISTVAQEMKQQGLDATLVVGSGAYEKDFDPGSAGNGTILVGTTALYMGEDAKVVPAVATFDKWAKKVDPRTQLDIYTMYGWASAELFAQALKGAGADPTRGSLDAQLDKVTSFDAGGLMAPQDPARKIPGQCWLAAEYENGTWHRIKPDPPSGFVCKPSGYYPAGYKGIAR